MMPDTHKPLGCREFLVSTVVVPPAQPGVVTELGTSPRTDFRRIAAYTERLIGRL